MAAWHYFLSFFEDTKAASNFRAYYTMRIYLLWLAFPIRLYEPFAGHDKDSYQSSHFRWILTTLTLAFSLLGWQHFSRATLAIFLFAKRALDIFADCLLSFFVARRSKLPRSFAGISFRFSARFSSPRHFALALPRRWQSHARAVSRMLHNAAR